MLRWERFREYAAGALWVLPSVAAVAALIAGWLVSRINIGPHSALAWLAFQGTADDARTLLVTAAGTVVTVIALVLGLAVVALQLSSTQFSPRLLRNFVRDRATQCVLSVFLATFAYTAAGLYTVGVSSGTRVQTYPRLAVSGAIVLLFASLAAVIYFADHLMHSIQIDSITDVVQRNTLAVIRDRAGHYDRDAPMPPAWAVTVPAWSSGYIQTAHPEVILKSAARRYLSVRLAPRVGQHVVAGTPLAWIWRESATDPSPDPEGIRPALQAAVEIGFERTLQQDAAFGIRQLVDVACKALSPAVNDPYTAVQAVHHLSVIFAALAGTPLGVEVVTDAEKRSLVIVPGRGFADYLAVMCGLIRRYGSREPTVSVALLELLRTCVAPAADHPDRLSAIFDQAALIVADADRAVAQPVDAASVHAAADDLHQTLSGHRARFGSG